MTTPTTPTAARLSAERLEEIRARANAATAGPWGHHGVDKFDNMGEWSHIVSARNGNIVSETPTGAFDHRAASADKQSHADATFIAHARTDIPALLAELDATRAERAEAARLSHEWRNTAERLTRERDEARKVTDDSVMRAAAVLYEDRFPERRFEQASSIGVSICSALARRALDAALGGGE